MLVWDMEVNFHSFFTVDVEWWTSLFGHLAFRDGTVSQFT